MFFNDNDQYANVSYSRKKEIIDKYNKLLSKDLRIYSTKKDALRYNNDFDHHTKNKAS